MNAERWRRVLGWSELVCGGLGITVAPWTVRHIPAITHPAAYLAGALIYIGLTALAGIGLLQRTSWGVALSACVQVPQLIWVATPSFLFKFVCGLTLLVLLTPGNLKFEAGFQVSTWFGHNPGPEQRLFALNLFPLLALRGLWRLRSPPTGAGATPSAPVSLDVPTSGSAA
jgi:hypothetical protein